MSRLSPPSILRCRLFIRWFCSPHSMGRPRVVRRWVRVSSDPSPAPSHLDASTVSVISDSSKVDSFGIAGKGKSSVAAGGVDSGKPLKISDYDVEFPELGACTGSGHKDYGKCRGVVDDGFGLTMIQDATPALSEDSRSTNRKSREGFRSSRRDHWRSGGEKRHQNPMRRANLPFDICVPGGGRNASVGKGSHVTETERGFEVISSPEILRPGMVLLKQYLTHDEQVDIVETCRRLGVGPGGFYRPGYRDGRKLCLQMMCLGLNWDPETKYSVKRAGMDCKPPDIPHEFVALVQQAISDASALAKVGSGAEDAESVIPEMSPDICIVNFYTATGRLGLHQDRDESRESIKKGLPIVSFSIGDSAEFLYGEHRDVERAEKVTLESGDVLIFGGESRLVFHGVKSVVPHSAPKRLLCDSKLRTGRLNLTFRQF
ncbi:PREDICTED: uncharacterized protein LOC104823314 [Tarenaya hassleriana]|uniref:uncharacterized protein LOC104823314 n=1 Tax=Tarenaya hassleriana TaxID=28532 RepID=UPI00053C289F|nr:PREDICTED: uncharacterized protein LOC104823314 [Tarenaya hassleriana]